MIEVPPQLAANLVKFYGDRGREWTAGLPALVADYCSRWGLAPVGVPLHGYVGLVVPVRTADSTPAALKLQIADPEHPGEAAALRTWKGDGAVRLLADDGTPEPSVMLLERLHPRDLTSEPDALKAVRIIAELLVRLHRHEAPPQPRSLAEVARGMLDYVPSAVALMPSAEQARRVRHWAAAVAEVAGEAGNTLLHWDLHFENVLAGDREPWLAIDPKPLRGDPGFEILPVLHNRWDEIAGAADPRREILRRYDLVVEVLGLDRSRADAWTLGRTLQNTLWNIEDGDVVLDPVQMAIADAITSR